MLLSENTSVIETVLGSIMPDQLGYCQCHEHIFIEKGKSYTVNPALWMDDLHKSTEELALFNKCGGLSIVDAQPVGCGRMAGFLLEASEASNVNIIASTGFHKMIFYDEGHWLRNMCEEQITDVFIKELTLGMYADGNERIPQKQIMSKAGIIKTAVESSGITGEYEKLFNAAANAALFTGAPIMCHVDKGTDALNIIEFFTRLGVPASSLILCHLDRACDDIFIHREVAGAGAFLEYDTIGRFKYHSDDDEISLISSMLESGFKDRILLGLDTTRERLKSYGAPLGLDYIFSSFIPALINAGISEKYISAFTVENPKRALRKTR